MQKSLGSKIAVGILLLTATAHAQFVAYNDHAPGPGTGPYTTTWNVEGQPPGRTGSLTNAIAGARPLGAQLPVTLTITVAGNVTFEGTQGNPSPGTPLYNAFNGFVDFNGAPNPSLALNGAGATVTYTITGLDPLKRYSFKGSAVRANAYADRWTLFELAGADSFTSAHTAGALTTAQVPGILANQCAVDTGANDGPTTGDMADWENIEPGADGSITVNSYQYLGTVPGGSSGGAKGYAMTGFRLEEFNVAPVAATITNQPQNVTVGELQPATFTVGATGNPRPSYQWYKDNTAILDATNSSYTIAATPLSYNGSVFKVVASNVTNGVPKSVTSSDAVLTVTADTTAPTVLRAASVSEISVIITFSEPLTDLTATNTANYAITNKNGSIAISEAVLQANGSNVVLTTSILQAGTNFTVVVNNLKDRSVAANTIAPNSTTTFSTVAGFTPVDIGAVGVPGSLTTVTGGFDVTGAGSDIGGTSDQFTYGYQQRSGDFDIKVRVQGLELADFWSKAGLMARQTLLANSAFAATLTTPAGAGSFFEYRSVQGGTANMLGTAPVNFPSTWLRLQRSGNNFTGYASLDGVRWASLGTIAITMTDPVYVGLAVTSHTNNLAAKAQFRDIGAPVGATTVSGLVSSIEPPGPSSRKTGLAITEIMYRPASRTDGRVLEFVEIYNSNPYLEDISGYRIAGDVDYVFPPNTILKGGSYLVIAKVPGDITAVYGTQNVMGPYTGSLPTSGTVRLRNQVGSILLEVPYSNKPPWPVAANGAGHSLVLARPSYGEGYAQGWAASDAMGGSPGSFDGYSGEPIRSVVINEFLAHTDGAEFIELYNHDNVEVDLSGAYLTDSRLTNVFRIPQGTTIPARGFVSFPESDLYFSLNAEGETIYLINSNNTRVVDAVRYEPQGKNVSFGRFPDGSPEFYALTAQTPGNANAGIVIGDIVINEVMYDPISENSDDEFIELYNKGSQAVDLSGWALTDGISFTFPSNTVINADGYLVIAKSRTNLLAHYANLNNANTFGDYGGTLANGGERIALSRPQPHLVTNGIGGFITNIILVVEDEITYRKLGRGFNWSAGGGSSLELVDPRSNHRLSANWADSDETQKASWSTIEGIGILDNGTVQSGGIDRVEILAMGETECLIDNVEVLNSSSANMLAAANSTFESGLGNWVPQGNHIRSTIEAEGFGSAQSLHMRSSARGDTGANRIRCALTAGMTAGSSGTIRAKVRWLHGWPELLIRLKGNYLEATGRMSVPTNLGTPGARNSRAVINAGPATYAVSHNPVVPAANTPVVVTARVEDPDGLASVVLKYRIDPSASYSSVTMADNGTGGDAVAGDGIFSGTIPGQAVNALVAFVVEATDGEGAVSVFPPGASLNTNECLVRFGDPVSISSYAVYRFWMTQNNVNSWINRPSLSNERVEGTFIYNNVRAIYNISGKYSGSPYHQGFSSPVANSCHYSLEIPGDDLLLGTDNFNKIHAPGNGPWDDTTVQREQASYWLVRQMGLPWNYRRYVNFVFNGNRRSPNSLMEDTQTPGGEVVSEVFPDDADGNLYKLQPWFEFDDVTTTGGAGAGFVNVSWCVMNQFLTAGNVKKLARYRHNYLARAVNGSANDYSDVYALVDAVSTPNSPQSAFTQAAESVVDVDQWLRTFAVEHCVGNWDSFGNRNAQNMYGYKPTNGKWQLMIWDYNIVLGNSGSDTPGSQLFQYQTADNNMGKFYSTPIYRRMYWRFLKELATVHMVNPQLNQILDQKYASFQASGLTGISSPQPIKDFLTGAAPSILSQLAAEDPGTFTVNGNSVITVSNNLVTFTGTAPVEAQTIQVNGLEYPVTWTGVSTWSITIAVPSGTTTFVFQGFDRKGNILPALNAGVTVTYNGPVVDPRTAVVINEIMFKPAVSNAQYIEILNNSSSFAFDLSNWRITGADFTFPVGTVITQKQVLVVAKNRAAFASAYGAGIPIIGEFDGNLDPEGEKLALVKPGPTSDLDQVINAVHYEAAAPWSPAALGGGASLQLIDAAQDSSRVSNWSDGSGWRFFSFTANPTGTPTNFSITLDGAGDFYIDDMVLVAGTVPGVGQNYFQNGDFETGSLPPWSAIGNHAASSVSTSIKHGGNASLHIVGTGPGSVGSSAVFQILSGVNPAIPHTVSFWFLPSTNVTGFNFRLTSSFRTLTSVNLRPSSFNPGAVNPAAGILEPFPLLYINEIEPNNVHGITDHLSQHDPWIELYNAGPTAISLDTYALANNYGALNQWPFPAGTTINPGEFKVVFADGNAAQTLGTELHTNFRLPATNGSIVLSQNGRILDYINYTNLEDDFSYGSFPDAQVVDRQLFYYPTPGALNNGAPVPIVINEWMAAQTNTLVNPATGRFDDWIELYNFGPAPIDLSGYFLTDNTGNKKQWSFPEGTVINSGGYLLIWADNNPLTNSTPTDLHANFALGRNGEQIVLYTPALLQVDRIDFGPQNNDISQGRYPDGNIAGVYHFMTSSTPGAANVVPVNQFSPVLPTINSQSANEGSLISLTALATDNDQPVQTLTYSLAVGAPAGATIDPKTGLFKWTPTEAQGGSVYGITINVSDNGSPLLTDSKTFNITVNKVNSPPVITPVDTRTSPELSAINFTVTATDSDLPVQTITFSLDPGAPAGASIDPSTGAFNWTPSEAQGPGTNVIIVRATDNGSPSASATQAVTLIITEVNTPPTLVNPGTLTIDEGKLYTNVLQVLDNDLPTNRFSFVALPPVPSGLTVNSLSGVLSWTPTESQGGSNYTVTIRVGDSGSPSMTSTQSFTITVLEVNAAPVLNNLNNTTRTINELTSISLTNRATDSDLPTNILSYEIVSAPVGATLDPVTGVFAWTPTEAQGPSSNSILVRVVDNGSPSLSATQRFSIVVAEVNTAPILSPIASKTVSAGQELTFTAAVTDSDIPAQLLTFNLEAGAPAGATINNSGLFSWTPAGGSQPSTNVVKIRVVDDGTPSLSATQSVTIFVTVSIRITDIHRLDASHVSVTWETQSGKNYQLEYRDNLDPATAWQLVTGSQTTASGPSQSFTLSTAASPQRFYRIVQTN